MVDFKDVAKKWQQKWQEAKLFDAVPDDRKKFFCSFPYPYINAYPHIGHLFTLMRVEAFARYKRLQGYNVLFPQGWHATGSPIIQAAKRVKEREPKQIKIMMDMGFSEADLVKFEKPEYWIEFFAPEFKKDYCSLGMSVDWRREFYTTSLNPRYDKFIQWQFRKLKEKGYVIKGKFPVVWDPKEQVPVGDHDRIEGEGETPKDFIWVKFRIIDSDLILMAGTTRPDALLGQTHLWLDPEATYKIVQVDDEKWVVGSKAVEKIQEQHTGGKVIGEIPAVDLIGKWVQGPLVDYPLYIIPASFIDAGVGSGVVYSALEDPADLIEIQHIQSNPDVAAKYNLDKAVVDKLKPISIIDVLGMSDNLGQDMIDKFKIVSPKEKKKVKHAKDELNRAVFRKGVMKENCGKYAKMTVPDAQDVIKKDLINAGTAVMFYELTGKVVARSLAECVVKIVDDQWFIDYGNEKWKKDAHEALDNLKLYPEKARQQFDYVIDWLHEWACTREEGLGTLLPWDEKWLIESLSDSTIYMAYYTIVHILNDVPEDQIDDDLFDYVFMNKNTKIQCDENKAGSMKKEFNYWYPVDFRNSGKDLIQNHLTFFIFNHTAIFPKDKWPKGIGVNGWVTVDGQKMSKSLGNMIPIRDMLAKYGPDAGRLTILAGGESMDDPNWDTGMAASLEGKFSQLLEFAKEWHSKGREETLDVDVWILSKLNRTIKDATAAMDKTMFRTALQRIYFDLTRELRSYMRKCDNDPNKAVLQQYLEAQVIMLSPFVPHVAEEVWEAIGKDGFVSVATWPDYDESKINEESEALIDTLDMTKKDILSVMELSKTQKPKKVQLFIASPWKYEFISQLQEKLGETRNHSDLIKYFSGSGLKQHMQVITKLLPKFVKDPSKMPTIVSTHDKEMKALEEAAKSLAKDFNCTVDVIAEEKSAEAKAKQAMPGKVAILLE